jgi:AcrR family transcriptional regulator
MMEKKSTKEIILEKALSLFAVHGYHGVFVGQIADEVGIKAPSLYKHFKSKQEIFEAILEEMKFRYQKQAASMQMNGVDAEKDYSLFAGINEEALVDMSRNLFLYYLHDEFVRDFRKMLTLEQFKSEELAALYTKQYVDNPIAYESMLFGLLSESNILVPENARIMAFQFYAPIFLMLTLCDRDPKREEEALAMIEQHVRQFARVYQKGEKGHG